MALTCIQYWYVLIRSSFFSIRFHMNALTARYTQHDCTWNNAVQTIFVNWLLANCFSVEWNEINSLRPFVCGVMFAQCDSNTRFIMCTRDLTFVFIRNMLWKYLFNVCCSFFSQGEDSVEYFLGLTPSGIVVLRNKTTVAYYYWPRIAKVYFKGRYFMLRVCDKNVRIPQTLNYISFAFAFQAFCSLAPVSTEQICSHLCRCQNSNIYCTWIFGTFS